MTDDLKPGECIEKYVMKCVCTQKQVGFFCRPMIEAIDLPEPISQVVKPIQGGMNSQLSGPNMDISHKQSDNYLKPNHNNSPRISENDSRDADGKSLEKKRGIAGYGNQNVDKSETDDTFVGARRTKPLPVQQQDLRPEIIVMQSQPEPPDSTLIVVEVTSNAADNLPLSKIRCGNILSNKKSEISTRVSRSNRPVGKISIERNSSLPSNTKFEISARISTHDIPMCVSSNPRWNICNQSQQINQLLCPKYTMCCSTISSERMNDILLGNIDSSPEYSPEIESNIVATARADCAIENKEIQLEDQSSQIQRYSITNENTKSRGNSQERSFQTQTEHCVCVNCPITPTSLYNTPSYICLQQHPTPIMICPPQHLLCDTRHLKMLPNNICSTNKRDFMDPNQSPLTLRGQYNPCPLPCPPNNVMVLICPTQTRQYSYRGPRCRHRL